MVTTMILGLLLNVWGALFVYLASPHQLFTKHILSAGPLRLMGLILFLCALLTFWQGLQPIAGVLTFVVITMMLLVLLPYLGAFLKHKRKWVSS